MIATDAAELSAVCSKTAPTRRTLTLVEHIATEGLAAPPIGVIHLLAVLLEDGALPREEPLLPNFIDTYRRCVQEVLRPLAAQHSTAALRDELALLPLARRYQAMGTAIGQWSARLGLPVLQPNRDLARYRPAELLRTGEDAFLDEQILNKLSRRWADFIDKCSPSTIPFIRSDLLVVRHFEALNTHAKRFTFATANQVAQRLGASVRQLVKPQPRGRGEAVTQLADPSSYPIGGYAGLTNHGSQENMLSSELVYLDKSEPLDWFTIRKLNNELLYYTRDEAKFARSSRLFELVFPASLGELRQVDEEFRCRRGLAALASIISLVESLPRYLGSTNLTIILIQLGQSEAKFNPSELLQIRFGHTTGVEHAQVHSLEPLPKGAQRVAWGDELTETYPGISLSGEKPKFTGSQTSPLASNHSPWGRAQSQLLSSLLQ